jgi:hypothetical protein
VDVSVKGLDPLFPVSGIRISILILKLEELINERAILTRSNLLSSPASSGNHGSRPKC